MSGLGKRLSGTAVKRGWIISKNDVTVLRFAIKHISKTNGSFQKLKLDWILKQNQLCREVWKNISILK